MSLSDEEWSRKSDRWIAEKCAVHHDTVSTVRKELSDSASSSPREGKDGKVRRQPPTEFRPILEAAKGKKAVQLAVVPEPQEQARTERGTFAPSGNGCPADGSDRARKNLNAILRAPEQVRDLYRATSLHAMTVVQSLLVCRPNDIHEGSESFLLSRCWSCSHELLIPICFHLGADRNLDRNSVEVDSNYGARVITSRSNGHFGHIDSSNTLSTSTILAHRGLQPHQPTPLDVGRCEVGDTGGLYQ
jgi:hypothetical protein